jgi:hypothetical protein
MKVAKNMDSVFANCTSDELDFDLMFDEDDSLIDAVCGVNEAGIPWTGPDPETEYQVDGDASYSEKDAEGSKDVDLPISGEAGKDGPYKGNSAESQAHDVTPGIKKAIGEGYYNEIDDLLSFGESDDVDKNDPDPSNDGDLDQDEVKEDYTMNYYDYDHVSEAVDTLCAGASAIDEAFEESTEALEEKVLNKALNEAEYKYEGNGKPVRSALSRVSNFQNYHVDKMKDPNPGKVLSNEKISSNIADNRKAMGIDLGKEKPNNKNLKIAAGIGAGAAAAIGTGVAIKKHLDKKKAQKQAQSQNESFDGFLFKEDGNDYCGIGESFGAGVAAVKGIKSYTKLRSLKSQNESVVFNIGGKEIPCVTESGIEDTDIVLTGFLKEEYDRIRELDRAQNILNIALEAGPNVDLHDYLKAQKSKEVSTYLKDLKDKSAAAAEKNISDEEAQKAAAAAKKLGKKGKIAAAVVGAAALAGAGFAAKKVHDKKKAQKQAQNESVVYYSTYETYYDESTDELSLYVSSPIAKLEGAKLGLAGEVIPTDESAAYGSDIVVKSVMESYGINMDEILDEDYIFVTEKFDFSKIAPSKIREAISAMGKAAVKFINEDMPARISAIIAAGASVLNNGKIAGKIMKMKDFKARHESAEAQLDDIIEAVMMEAEGNVDMHDFLKAQQNGTVNDYIKGLQPVAKAIDKAAQQSKNKKLDKKAIIGIVIAAGLSAVGLTGFTVHKKKKQKEAQNESYDPIDAALEAYDPF